jgi:hypothetical protein
MNNQAMAGTGSQPQRKRALFGVRGDYADALEQRLAQTEAENAELAESLRSARLALAESTGWSQRLPAALRELASLAAGELDGEDAEQNLASAVLELAGEHLLASVDIRRGDPTGEIESETQRNENGRPIRTSVRVGACMVDCTWQPGIEAGPDTTEVVASLCMAVVCSLAGVEGSRVQRDVVTQLGDKQALARHLALRRRLEQPVELVRVIVDGQSAIAHRELYGRLAWSASLAQTAGVLDRLARSHGGQAYQTADREFGLLVDADRSGQACELAEEALGDQDGLIFRVEIARR